MSTEPDISLQDKHGAGDSHRSHSSPVSSSAAARHRERLGSRVINIPSNHTNNHTNNTESHNNYSRENSQV